MTAVSRSTANHTTKYEHFGPKLLAKRDDREKVCLFPEEKFGAVPNLYANEEYLDNYWKYFHLQFPVIHKATSSLTTRLFYVQPCLPLESNTRAILIYGGVPDFFMFEA